MVSPFSTSIRDKSSAQIKVEPKSKQTNPVMTSLDITGTDEQIEEAFELINKEIALRDSQQNRCQQNYSQMAIPVTKPLTIDIEASDSPLDLDHYFSRLNRIGVNEVFVSAVKSPDEFYVQIAGVGAQHLDLLVEEITAFYSNEDNRICFKPTSVRMGDIVAVPFPHDDHWYRARVVAIETSLESEVESTVNVFYVDYGNQLVLEYNQICTLKDQFLRRLPFQAMCCSLYGVQPNDHLNWSQQSIQKFQELSHLEKWKPLFAKVIEMKIIDGKHEIYCIDLIDKNPDISGNEESNDDDWDDNTNVMHLNIALELIAKDFAIACDDSKDISILKANDFSIDDYEEVKNSRNFTGKVVLVTGSSSGIGEGITKLFSVLGASVVVTGRKEADVQRVAQEVEKLSPYKLKPLQVVADLTKPQDVEHLINETIKAFGKLDVLVNNAGIYPTSSIGDSNLMEEWDQVFNIDLRAVVQLIHTALPHLEATNGTIIHISSIAGIAPTANMVAYSSAKAALDMLTRVLALELGSKGVRVNAINPGATKMGQIPDVLYELVVKHTPLVVADLAKDADVERVFNETVKTFKRLDVLVNNAGSYHSANGTDKDFVDILQKSEKVDVHSALHLIRLSVPYLAETKGRVVNISSTYTQRPQVSYLAYEISKQSLEMVTKVLALELAPKGIRVNTLSVGVVQSSPRSDMPADTLAMFDRVEKITPLGRARNIDMAKGVVFLASSDADFITGHNLVVDGGLKYNMTSTLNKH
ncbi:unnamed protein product [Oppiella nova]|uniref:Tudor domain-containing protein n=1 Tax=Oppiella nova TaxID=334625 RepID=A0A7R9LQT4_9ACAR|nr:unnamed protein product [Oppiella nova]CAG2165703.1 unnamed protein product [Oppiella nova]